ncbi:MAG TPA: TonB-dependent receptor [Candidatus Eremiobacteraceae bacterium]|jgi:outer membrane receptor protein involved in Fe transport
MFSSGFSRVCARARNAACVALLTLTIFAPIPVKCQAALGGVTVAVVNDDGHLIAGALVTLRGDKSVRTFRTFSGGIADQSDLAPGVYVVSVVAAGFAPLGGRTIEVRAGRVTAVRIELDRSTSSLVVLGRVTTHAGEALSTSSVPSQELGSQQYAASGGSSVAGMINDDAISVTVIRPAGGNPAAPAVVALRGSDPTETLVDVDGHSVNGGGTGAFDLSLIDPAELAGVQLVYGIAPSSLIGPNTIDGAINVRTLDPTSITTGLLRLSTGSFGTFAETLQQTGTAARLGYAISVHRTTGQGEVKGQSILTTDGDTAIVGSAIAGSTGLLKLRYDVGRPGGSVEVSVRDQSEYRDLSAALTSLAPPSPGPAVYRSFAGSALAAHDSAYGLDVQMPLGRPGTDGQYPVSSRFSHQTALSDQSVVGPASSTTPYLFNTRDLLTDDSLQFDRQLGKGTFSIKFDIRTENLNTQTLIAGTPDQSRARQALDVAASGPQPLPALKQTQRSAVVRYAFDATSKLHYSTAVYLSDFTSFGSSVDPRLGIVWTPTAQTALRGSVGTTFQSPQLPELYVPSALPAPDANGFINIGNPNLKADHATDFDLGIGHIVSTVNPSRIDLDLYQTNLRTPSVRFLPAVTCAPPNPPIPACESFPINAGGAVYRGVEIRAERALSPSTTLRAAYSVNSSFATTVSPQFQNGSIVPGEQFQSVPLHRAVLSLQHTVNAGLGFEAGSEYEDGYNELNRPAFVTAHAGVTWHLQGFDIGLFGTNLTNVYDDRFTLSGQGRPYGGIDSPLPSDAYSLQGRAFSLVVTRRY